LAAHRILESVEIRPGKLNATLAGATEIGCGTALVLGAATPLASAGLLATMITTIRKVHFASGPFIQSHGYEYNLVLMGVLLTLAEEGPGYPAFDRGDRGRNGALIALATGLVGSFLAEAIGQQVAGPASVPAKSPDASSPVEASAPSST
jgi:putative oxidoreductase